MTKNSYGISLTFHPGKFKIPLVKGKLSGSSLDRKKNLQQVKKVVPAAKTKPKLRSMSSRTKSKIKKKIMAFGQLYKKLSFLTLTFCNQVSDQVAVKILGKFLENVNKVSEDFQDIWVAERQKRNIVFKDNIHFHIISNKYWKKDKWWKYWLDLQAKHGIVPRDESYKPTSAFDVRGIRSNNIRGISTYVTKYVTKNFDKFDCQVWNCSKKISRLYTDIYSDFEFLANFETLEKANLLGGNIKKYSNEYYDAHIIPLNRKTLPFYRKIDDRNKRNWNFETGETKYLSDIERVMVAGFEPPSEKTILTDFLIR